MEKPVLDDLDLHLLRLLREDSRRSFRELAKLAKTTTPTAAARVRRMETFGVIQGYTVHLDPRKFGADDVKVAIGPARVQCHTCHGWTARPLWATVAGARHPFCCVHCRDTFRARHTEMQKGL